MILAPFSFFAVSGLPPVNLTPALIETIGPITLEYTPGAWNNAVTVGYVWYSDGIAEDEVTGTFTTLPNVEVTLVETAVNTYGETVQVSNSITIPGAAIDGPEESAGMVVTHTGTYSPSNEYSVLAPNNAGMVVTHTGSCIDSAELNNTAGIVISISGGYIEQTPITAENSYYSHYITGTMGDTVTASPTTENSYYSHYITGTLV